MSAAFILRKFIPSIKLTSSLEANQLSFVISSLGLRSLHKYSSYKNMSTHIDGSHLRLVAVAQMTATADKEKNYQVCAELIKKAAEAGSKVVFLPEGCDYIAESQAQSQELAEDLDGCLMHRYQKLAEKHKIWISVAGFHQKIPSKDKMYNTHVLISSDGKIQATYNKLHLFDVDLPEKNIKIKESDYIEKGNAISDIVETPVGKIGLGICYDLRFPEYSISLAQRGAEILTYPSAFTVPTGLAHWESLLRSRAIENQCYVVAAAQTGSHNAKRTSYGHAMIVDPWGTVIAQCKEGTGIALAEIDLNYLKKVRQEMPVWNHRRPDVYGKVDDLDNRPQPLPKDDDIFPFGQVKIKGSMVFFKSASSVAFVNKRCVVPGHVLVIPIREGIVRLAHMKPFEVADLFQTVQKVQMGMEKFHKANSSNVTVQDGPDAGQTIYHVHVHILPRHPGDFPENNDIYTELEKHDKGEQEWRTEEEMIAEASELRKFFATLFPI